MTDLRSQLHRVADAVEPLPVDDDLWQRGVAARRRGQALVLAAVLAIIASITWSAVLLQTPDREARTASTLPAEGAIPQVIAGVPADLEPTSDLAVGRASVAFVSGQREPVVVTASDGVAHVLDLPSFGPDRAAYALSPDGRRLAYGAEPDGTLARIEVVDLETGESQVYGSSNTGSLEFDALAWSPGGTWLGWTSTAVGDRTGIVGAIRVGGRTQREVFVDGTVPQLAAADDGSLGLSWIGGALAINRPGADLDRIRPAPPGAAGAFSPDGRLLALASGPGRESYTLDVTTRQVLRHPFPDDTLADSVVRPVGWVDERLQLFLVQPVDGSDAELVVTTPEVDDQSTWRRRVGSVAATGVTNLSVAVDLVPDLDGTSSQELTHDFGDTTPGQRDVSWIIGLGVAAAIAVLMALRWLWRRLLG
ncbi:hypothetical protein L2K70_10505 [Nocardioides KLBMP 9356]|uniref:WD40 repeat domain-containing protein n=1 Tax=Nocardioides potassii TaxID=2911371 RepID=A0ABS9H9Z8_9ACTN|nr:hypothetical protein [Nocardioides potassii]MCF6378037.1 hypothetical protein [Nocardioides potassii]